MTTPPVNIDAAIDAFAEAHHDQGVLTELAATLVAQLTREHPAEWQAWLNARGREVVLSRLRTHAQSTRAAHRHRRGRETFAEWREAYAAGEAVEPLKATYCVDTTGTWKPLGEMVRSELLYVARHREANSRTLLLDAALMRVLARRLPDDRTPVAEVWSDEMVAKEAAALVPELPPEDTTD